jgi:hypothetical protein
MKLASQSAMTFSSATRRASPLSTTSLPFSLSIQPFKRIVSPLATLFVKNVGSDVVERCVNDAAVNGILPADMIGVRCEFRAAGATIAIEDDMQTNRVIFATGKAHGGRFDLGSHYR